nr:EOG090X08ST [Lepidurus arcticus]
METETFIRTIEWDMMDKTKFFPLSVTSSFTIRAVLYPFTLIKTRLQIQRGNEVYRGTFDAYRKILKYEGFSGLYRGFWINAFSVVSGAFYIATYENVRHFLHNYDVTDSRVKALVAGGAASLVGQTIIVPFDVLSQHLMMMGRMDPKRGGQRDLFSSVAYFKVPTDGLASRVYQVQKYMYSNKNVASTVNLHDHQRVSDWKATMWIAQRVYEKDGWRGFYRGNIAALSAAVPGGALWWFIYHVYQENLLWACPSWVPHLSIQCTSAILSGATTTTLLNPLDIIRARMQIQRLGSVTRTFRDLWHEEKMFMFTKGLSARLIQVAVFSFLDILGYETIKRLSVQPEYANKIKW